MEFLNLFFKKKIDFQNKLHHSQFLNLFKKRIDAKQALKNYINIKSSKTLLNYLYQRFPSNKIPHYDYPLLFHYKNLSDKIKRHLIVNDFGGSFGQHYNAVSRFIPDTLLEWNIYEEDSIINDLKFLHSKTVDQNMLNFYSINDEFKKCDLVYTSGSLQYLDIDSPLELLSKIKEKPMFVIFNQIPLDQYIDSNYYTLQNIFNQIVVNTIFSRENFVNEMNLFGYILVDQWKDYSANCNIIDHDYNLPFYTGQFYKRKC